MPRQLPDWQALADEFASAKPEFSPVPIWWWSGETLEPNRLRWQMEQFIKGGVYNVVLLNLAPTSPLFGSEMDDPPFMSERWWQIFLGVCADAKELGMRLWFYDQLGFSGANFQGQIVNDNPAFAGQKLQSAIIEGTNHLSLRCPTNGIALTASYVDLDEDNQPMSEPKAVAIEDGVAQINTPNKKRLRLIYAVRYGFDYYSAQACQALFDVVHGEFERRASHYFGDVIVGSFQDELPTMLSWSANFAVRFEALKGYSLLENLWSLFEGTSEASQRVRIDYHQVRATLAEACFFKPLFDWHERHNLTCGFDQQGPARSGHPIGGVSLYADYLRTHRWYQAPGSDHHGDAKIHSSLAHLYGRDRVWIEAFHSSGWGGTLEETLDWLLPWLRAGATLYNPHAVYYSTRGGWWEWAPPSTCWRQPYWQHYQVFADTISRLTFLLSQGHHVCDIGILYPTTTIQAGLTLDGALPFIQITHDIYTALTGSMMFLDMQEGALDAMRRDYDILDEASIQRAVVSDYGKLKIGQETYRVVILPACTALEAQTCERLLDFIEEGGLLIAVGRLPQFILSDDGTQLKALLLAFEQQRAMQLEVDALADALASAPRFVDAPVPTLQRRIGQMDVIFVPATYPQATQSHTKNWLYPDYTFDKGRYQAPMQIKVNGLQGAPTLWNAVTGAIEEVTFTIEETGTMLVTLTFDTAPFALLVWANGEQLLPQIAAQALTTTQYLTDEWTYHLEPTLDNRYGDFAKPNQEGSPPLQTWHLQHRLATSANESWDTAQKAVDWREAIVTYGDFGWWSGVRDLQDLPQPLAHIPEKGTLDGDGWQTVSYSLQRGIYKDVIHAMTLGPKGHVPEEFIQLGIVEKGQGVQFRTVVWMEETLDLHFALGAPHHKSVWINGQFIGESGAGYLWLHPVTLSVGANLIEWRLTASHDREKSLLWWAPEVPCRAYWALVNDVANFSRPERIVPSDGSVKDSRVVFSSTIDLKFAPKEAIIQVTSTSPCALLVNGVEIGHQGGFQPYDDFTSQVQRYTTEHFRRGHNRVELYLADLGVKSPKDQSDRQVEPNAHTAVMLDGLIIGEDGTSQVIVSGSDWLFKRDDSVWGAVNLYRQPWGDPAWTMLARRPHPLPGTSWLEDESHHGDVVMPVVPDAYPHEQQTHWFKWVLPSCAIEMTLPIKASDFEVWLDNQKLTHTGQRVTIPHSEMSQREVYLRVVPHRGYTGGAIFTQPVSYKTATGRIKLGSWSEQGLHSYSGGIRYQTKFVFEEVTAMLWLDLGEVRGTAEVSLNGLKVGVKVWSPYRFDISNKIQVGENNLEIVIFNTLAPYLNAVSPTHYIAENQIVSGLIGPVALLY